jgi:excinuclease ABC subunit B
VSAFEVVSPLSPSGDQPRAIAALVEGFRGGRSKQVLLGVTGSGKTFTMAKVVEALNVPTLVLSHNKTLAAQLYQEFRSFFPKNRVEYFVSYYDYYQPEAYVPQSDTYIEKETDINEEIDKLRISATAALFERRDVLIVASVSCIYGLGSPESFGKMAIEFATGARYGLTWYLKRLVEAQYERTALDLARGSFRVRGDLLEIQPSYEDTGLRVEFFGDEIERISRFEIVTGKTFGTLPRFELFPKSHYVTPEETRLRALGSIEAELGLRLGELKREGKLLEAQRLEQRTRFDLEMIRELGYCPGIENYSRHLSGRKPGEPPPTLLDYFPEGFLTIVDESHQTVPQLHAMYHGDRSRKATLVAYGFRLPSALDNRPLTFEEWLERVGPRLFVSATPAAWELSETGGEVVEQVIRPTGLLDPPIEVRPVKGQVDDLLSRVRERTARGERTLVTTLTKRMAEDLTSYLLELGVRVRYLHSDVETLERVQVIGDFRRGVFDVLVGVNLLREGLDLPEVSLVAVLDADKEGFLRSETSLIQTAGRAARNLNGLAVFYADRLTDAILRARSETERRRAAQKAFNEVHGIRPESIVKAVDSPLLRMANLDYLEPQSLRERAEQRSPAALDAEIGDLEKKMKEAARSLEFETAAQLRDRIRELRAMKLFG